MKKHHKIAIREHYESLLAGSVLRNKHLLDAVDKISQRIIELIDGNFNKNINLHAESIAIEDEMYHPDFFGRINLPKQMCNTPTKTLSDLRAILINKNTPLELVMHVHALFMSKIYNKLENKIPHSIMSSVNQALPASYSQKIANKIRQAPDKINGIVYDVVKQIFHNELFFKDKNTIDRARELKNIPVKNSNLIGIDRSETFKVASQKSDYVHVRGADRFNPDFKANYTKLAMEKSLPLVAGPSGHAGGIMMCAVLLGDLSQEEMEQYGLATISYLVGGGNHAFHEVASVLNKVGIPHVLGEYAPTLPASYKASHVYNDLNEVLKKILIDKASQEVEEKKSIDLGAFKTFYHEVTGLPLEFSAEKNSTCIYDWQKLDATIAQKRICLAKESHVDNIGTLQPFKPSIDLNPQSISLSDIVSLSVSALTFFGFFKVKPLPSAEVAMNPEIKKILTQQQKIKDVTVFMAELGVLKYFEKDEKHKGLVVNFLLTIENNTANNFCKNEFAKLYKIQKDHLRWKALIKIARDQKSASERVVNDAIMSLKVRA